MQAGPLRVFGQLPGSRQPLFTPPSLDVPHRCIPDPRAATVTSTAQLRSASSGRCGPPAPPQHAAGEEVWSRYNLDGSWLCPEWQRGALERRASMSACPERDADWPSLGANSYSEARTAQTQSQSCMFSHINGSHACQNLSPQSGTSGTAAAAAAPLPVFGAPPALGRGGGMDADRGRRLSCGAAVPPSHMTRTPSIGDIGEPAASAPHRPARMGPSYLGLARPEAMKGQSPASALLSGPRQPNPPFGGSGSGGASAGLHNNVDGRLAYEQESSSGEPSFQKLLQPHLSAVAAAQIQAAQAQFAAAQAQAQAQLQAAEANVTQAQAEAQAAAVASAGVVASAQGAAVTATAPMLTGAASASVAANSAAELAMQPPAAPVPAEQQGLQSVYNSLPCAEVHMVPPLPPVAVALGRVGACDDPQAGAAPVVQDGAQPALSQRAAAAALAATKMAEAACELIIPPPPDSIGPREAIKCLEEDLDRLSMMRGSPGYSNEQDIFYPLCSGSISDDGADKFNQAPEQDLHIHCETTGGDVLWVNIRKQGTIAELRSIIANQLRKQPAQVMLRLGDDLLSASNELVGNLPAGSLQVVLTQTAHIAVATGDPYARIYSLGTSSDEVHFGHTGHVNIVAWNPEGTKLATGSNDGIVRVFDVESEKEEVSFEHFLPVRCLAWSPDGTKLATGADDFRALIFDLCFGKEEYVFRHNMAVLAVAFSPDGKKLATGSSDDHARIFDLQTGSERGCFRHLSPVHAVDWNGESSKIATASGDRCLRIIDVMECEEEHRFEQGGQVLTVAWSSSGKKIAAGGRDNAAYVLDATTYQVLHKFPHGGHVNSVCWSPDGIKLATASSDGLSRVIDVLSGAEESRHDHGRFVHSISWCPLPPILPKSSCDPWAGFLKWPELRDKPWTQMPALDDY